MEEWWRVEGGGWWRWWREVRREEVVIPASLRHLVGFWFGIDVSVAGILAGW